jgi:dTDP-glucose pyrophosphorylase
MLNIVIPMAGLGSRFSKAGYELPKPLIATHEKPMIEVVLRNLMPSVPHQFILICQNEHLDKYPIEATVKKVSPSIKLIGIDGLTEGAACTVLLSEQFINNDNPLMIANCDQYVAVNMDTYLQKMEAGNLQGLIMTMTANDNKWSFIAYDDNKLVKRVVEKEVISDEATVGIYNYSKGRFFVEAAHEMILKNDRVKNEFYVAPVYNYMIKQNMNIGFYNIGSDRNGMWGLGIPEDLEYFNLLTKLP